MFLSRRVSQGWVHTEIPVATVGMQIPVTPSCYPLCVASSRGPSPDHRRSVLSHSDFVISRMAWE